MNIQLQEIPITERSILENLLQKYLYEFSQYDGMPFAKDGLFHYPYLSCYWTDQDRYPYFIWVDGRLAGFVLVNRQQEWDRPLDFAIAEFFIAYPYRKQGVGRFIMKEIFRRHKGDWQIKYHPKNIASKAFWLKMASLYANDTPELVTSTASFIDGTFGEILIFQIT